MFRALAAAGSILYLASCASAPEPMAGRAAPVASIHPAEPVPGANPYLYPRDAPAILAQSAMMIDARTGQTLYYKNPDQLRGVASTQKLLMALTLLDRCSLEQEVTVASPDTQVEPSRLGLRPGDRYRRRDLLNAMMVKSSNDAANVLARTCTGSVVSFMALANGKAFSLGARRSNFVNPHGLTAPGQYSTARDMARIAFVAYREPTLRQMMRMPAYTFHYANGRSTTLKATNKLLTRSPIYTGMKTGYTAAAGRCLITSASWNGRAVILVQLGSKTSSIFEDAELMTNWQLQRERIF